ncbi:hypothetical protein CLTEP_15360 [Clostridium tepidiprofundi DSM 19306]|uniref:DUF2344 domain-containing protein n=1 Tax=Clostridium tepidiprofundi DSM 19306 TaxID=1121338 RepID=A0A151B3I7_9CLOT|nr:hypothetical protein CLTEP_15360 [Clostridium tepidiprofundi DSM 19306]
MRVRYLIKYTKESEIKFVSHLDLMRTIQRTFRRAELPVEYSKGFNPHMMLSIAQPLSVGMYSSGEYLDIIFFEEVNENEIIDKLNMNAPGGIKFLDAVKVVSKKGKKDLQAMALIDAASYILKFKFSNSELVEEEIKTLLKKESWETVKKTKKGKRDINIKPLIKEFKYWIKDDNLVIRILAACGSRENLSAQLLGEYIKENCEGLEKDRFIEIKREEMYAYKDEKLLPLNKYFR